MVEFLLNLKECASVPSATAPARCTSKPGEREVTAGDIQAPADFEIANPDLHLATLDPPPRASTWSSRSSRAVATCPPAASKACPSASSPWMPSSRPVSEVNYRVEKTRVGQVPELRPPDPRSLDRRHDRRRSSGRPRAEILIDQFALFSDGPPAVRARRPRSRLRLLHASGPLQHPHRGPPALRARLQLPQAQRPHDGRPVLEKSEDELLALRNFGRKSYDELRDKLISKGFPNLDAQGVPRLRPPHCRRAAPDRRSRRRTRKSSARWQGAERSPQGVGRAGPAQAQGRGPGRRGREPMRHKIAGPQARPDQATASRSIAT